MHKLHFGITYNQLSQIERNTINWLTRNHHGLQFEDGFIRTEDIPQILSICLKDVDRIYVKGAIKYTYLINNLRGLRQVVINLEDFNGDVPKLLPGPPCKFHLNQNQNVICALYNVMLIYNYLSMRLPL